MTARDTALAFVRRFCSGNLEGLASLLADDLEFRGPLLTATSAADYLAALRADPPVPGDCRIVSVTERDGEVAVNYVYSKPAGPVAVRQTFRFRDGLIAGTRVAFDTAAGESETRTAETNR